MVNEPETIPDSDPRMLGRGGRGCPQRAGGNPKL